MSTKTSENKKINPKKIDMAYLLQSQGMPAKIAAKIAKIPESVLPKYRC